MARSAGVVCYLALIFLAGGFSGADVKELKVIMLKTRARVTVVDSLCKRMIYIRNFFSFAAESTIVVAAESTIVVQPKAR